jgi:hypothetical protein
MTGGTALPREAVACYSDRTPDDGPLGPKQHLTYEARETMQRKDYVLIAAALCKSRIKLIEEANPFAGAVQYVAEVIADVIEIENPKFDRARFLAAVNQDHMEQCPAVNPDSTLYPTCYCRRSK